MTLTTQDGKTLSCVLSNGETKEIKIEVDGSVPTNKPTIVFENGAIKKVSNFEIQGSTVRAASLKLAEYKNEILCKASTKLTNGTGVLAIQGIHMHLELNILVIWEMEIELSMCLKI